MSVWSGVCVCACVCAEVRGGLWGNEFLLRQGLSCLCQCIGYARLAGLGVSGHFSWLHILSPCVSAGITHTCTSSFFQRFWALNSGLSGSCGKCFCLLSHLSCPVLIFCFSVSERVCQWSTLNSVGDVVISGHWTPSTPDRGGGRAGSSAVLCTVLEIWSL